MKPPSCIIVKVKEDRTGHSGANSGDSINAGFSSFACFFSLKKFPFLKITLTALGRPYINGKNGNREMNSEAIAVTKVRY